MRISFAVQKATLLKPGRLWPVHDSVVWGRVAVNRPETQ
jgi:predicted metal-dependent enzyme (double-stranded beta helix superfamily)